MSNPTVLRFIGHGDSPSLTPKPTRPKTTSVPPKLRLPQRFPDGARSPESARLAFLRSSHGILCALPAPGVPYLQTIQTLQADQIIRQGSFVRQAVQRISRTCRKLRGFVFVWMSGSMHGVAGAVNEKQG